MNLKNVMIIVVVASYFTLATLSFGQLTQTPFATETDEDIKEALVNLPERVPFGHEVATKAGEQISPGSDKSDYQLNQETYNDIYDLQRVLLSLMQMVLDAGIKPEILPRIEAGFGTAITLLTNIGVRYNLSSNFLIQVNQLRAIGNTIKNAPRSADFMLLKVQLEVMLAEIQNILATKLTSAPVNQFTF
jgi:hypothetical protein